MALLVGVRKRGTFESASKRALAAMASSCCVSVFFTPMSH